MIQILVLLTFLFGGALAASIRLAPKPRVVEVSITAALWLLLFSMGFRIGNNPELVHSIGTIGLLGFASAVFTIAGSCVAVVLVSHFAPAVGSVRKIGTAAQKENGFSAASSGPTDSELVVGASSSVLARLKPPAILLSVVVAGFIAGIALPRLAFDPGLITEWTLNALLFLIGMQFRQSQVPLASMLRSPAVIALPLATAVGSMAAGLLLVPFFSLRVGKALALASGFGWYSLSGVLISNLGDPVLGSSAFLANMIRESLGLILIPVLGQTRVPTMAISVAGATSMDVSLPLIEQTLGPEAVPLSFISGAFLSALVPVLVPLFMKL
ncbi:MAG: lysine exporter LysO family protein [Spirochaetota bacterium]